ncbi:enoyl-CoA hydratase/isomerase family protein [Ruegeria pomeroyi]|uniref:Enoyl-CoA hydratase/isomerase family protein n=1 Tax=Ruegeria pomeroyi TaxID=89184 RepID=A0A9Q3WPZ2_9RHOB|nr:enoyl-CoA hydratase-related protein [Ruegeria pomeroyi]MCE8539513.1 enoyl-CoA hydratase/isomerase family protein [Ruegeria pomeroyi]
MSKTPETIELIRDGHWMTIRLNRPERRNAMTRQMTSELTDALFALRDDRAVRGITLRGNGGWFCAGGDLAEFRTDFQSGPPDRADIEAASRAAGTLFHLLNTMPQVTLALVEGGAMAGGLGLMCACDISVATEDATFALTETTLGLPPAQIAPFVRSRVGLAKARQMMLTAPRFTGTEAGRLGLVSTVVTDHDGLEAEEARLRAALRLCAPSAVAVTKKILLDRVEDNDTTILSAASAFAGCILSDEGREGVASFFEKRRPSWARMPEDQA